MVRLLRNDTLSQAKPQLLQLNIAGLTDVTVAISQRVVSSELWPDDATGIALVASEYERLFFENQLPPILPRIIMIARKGDQLLLQDACPVNRTSDEVLRFVHHMWKECDEDSEILARFSFSEAITTYQEMDNEIAPPQLALVSVLKTNSGWQQLRVLGFDRENKLIVPKGSPIVRTMDPKDPEHSESFVSVFTPQDD